MKPKRANSTDKIINAAGAAKRVLKKFVSKEDLTVSEEVSEQRMSLCKSNLCGNYDLHNNKCLVCGCFLNLKTKLTTEECPMGYWGRA